MFQPERRVSPRSASGWLIEQARDGAPEARAELVRRHWSDAYRVAFLLTHDAALSEDLAQEGCLSALGALDSFDSDRPFVPWLRRITANKAYDWYRSQTRRPEVIDSETVDAAKGDQLVEDIVLQGHDDRLHVALQQLEPHFRVPIVLRFLVELEPVEIAELLDIPAATVRTRIFRGLRILRDHLTQDRGAVDEQAG